MRSERSSFLRLGPCLAALALAACGPGDRIAREVLVPFMEAVQQIDLDRLYCMCAGAAESAELGPDEAVRKDNFEAWAVAQYDRYYEGRDAGWVDLDREAIRLVKLFSLGRGTYFTFGASREAGDDGLRVETELRFGYRSIDLSRLSPGTTFYLNGVPPGRVHAVRVPSGPQEIDLEVLEGVTVEWSLVRSGAAGSCAGGWSVAAAVPVPGSERSTRVSWMF